MDNVVQYFSSNNERKNNLLVLLCAAHFINKEKKSINYSSCEYKLVACMIYLYYIINESDYTCEQIKEKLLKFKKFPSGLRSQIAELLKYNLFRITKMDKNKLIQEIKIIIKLNINIFLLLKTNYKKYKFLHKDLLKINFECTKYHTYLLKYPKIKNNIYNIKKKIYSINTRIIGYFDNKSYNGTIIKSLNYNGKIFKNGYWITVLYDDNDIQDYLLEDALKNKEIILY